GALPQAGALAEALPGLPVVVRAEERPVLGLDQRPDAAGLRTRGRHADLANHPFGQPLVARDLLPRVPAVGRAEQPALRPAAHQRVGSAMGLPDARVEDARVIRVHREIDRPGPLAAVEHLLPGLPTVGGAENATLLVRPEDVTECGDVDDVRVLRVDADAADGAGVGQAEMLPGAPAVGRLVDAVPLDDIAADGCLPGAHVDHIGIGLGDRDRADSGGGEVAVGDVLPSQPAIDRLPDTPGAG